jgi:hypothetical protein
MLVKNWKRSKTILLNGLVVAVGAIDYVAPFLPPHLMPIIYAATGVANVFLRTITDSAIKF